MNALPLHASSSTAASRGCTKVREWLSSTRVEGDKSEDPPAEAALEACQPGVASERLVTASARPVHPLLPTIRNAAFPAEYCSADLELDVTERTALPALLLRGPSFPSPTCPIADDSSTSLDGSPRSTDGSPPALGPRMRDTLSNFHRFHGGSGANEKSSHHWRCPALCSDVEWTRFTSPEVDSSAASSCLPLTSGGPLAAADAVQERVEKLFLGSQFSGTTSPLPPEHFPIPASTQHIVTACHRVKNREQSCPTSITSSTTLFTELANELDISSSAGTNTHALSSPRSIFGSGTETPPGEARSYHGAPKPSWDEARVAALQSLNLLGTPPEARFDHITNLVAQLLGTHIAIISLIDSDTQFFKSSIGFGGATETARRDTFCSWTLLSAAPECLVVPNALDDVRFSCNPFVVAPPAVRAYISAPLVSSTGARIGTLCVVDLVPRHFTAQDCELLCNCAELAVREFEAARVEQERSFGAGGVAAVEDESSRGFAAWDVGILAVSIRDGGWEVMYANDRCRAVLGIADVEGGVVGRDFWSVFSARGGGHGRAAVVAAAARQRGFDADVAVFTDAGRKHWLSAGFRCGATEHLDAQRATIGFPIDVASEPGLHRGVWFVTLQPMQASGGLHDSHKGAAAAAEEVDAAAEVLARLPMHVGLAPEQVQGIRLGAHIAYTSKGELLHARVLPAAASDPCGGRPDTAGGTALEPEAALVELLVAPRAEAAAEALRGAQRRWLALGLADFAVLDGLRTVVGGGAVVLMRRAPCGGAVSLRTAIHDGMLRLPPPDLEAAAAVDVRMVLDAFMHAVAGLERLHAAGAAHGDISDATLLFTHTPACGSGAMLRFATLGRLDAEPRPALERLADVRQDLPAFVAPEAAAAGAHTPATPEADVWAIGVALAYSLRPTLPHVSDGPLSLQGKAREGALLADVIRTPLQTLPQNLPPVVAACLDADPAARPPAGALLRQLRDARDAPISRV